MRKICLLGGTGFVGKQLINQLVKQKWLVKVLTRRREQYRDLLVLPSVELITTDVHDLEQLKAQLIGCDAVINLVGILNESGNDGAGFRKAHLELTQKVIEACQATNVTRLLHVSALNADAEQGTSHYLRSKGEAENLVHAAKGLQVTSFRPSVIFGENDSFFNRFAQLLRVPSPIFMLPSGEAKFAPVWVNDVVAAMILTLDNPQHEGNRYNLCGPKIYTLKELVAYTAKMMGVKRYIIPLKNKSSFWAARVMELIPGKPYSIDNYNSAQLESVCGENNHLLELGITPHSVESIMPKYFTPSDSKAFYSQFRHQARR
jgi:nucleoside-diphosphate-sugar epimerase